MESNKLNSNIPEFQYNTKSKRHRISNSTEYAEELVISNLIILPLIVICLNSKDKIQLSSVCKSLRLLLESSIFRKIKLFPVDYFSISTKYGRNLHKREVQSIFLDQVIDILSTKSHLVKEIVIKDTISNAFAEKYFSIFCHITHLKFQQIMFQKYMLDNILLPLKNLEYLHFECYHLPSYKDPSDTYINFHLPKPIKTFICEGDYCYHTYLDSLQIIDKTYTNLQRITLTNSDMLRRFKSHHPSLVELSVSHHTWADIPLIEEILLINPQIIKLSIPGTWLTESFINNILFLKNLTSLTFTCESEHQDYTHWTLVDNFSITTIQLKGNLKLEIQSLLLNSFKKLKMIQFYTDGLKVKNIVWENYHGSLKVIEFPHFKIVSDNFDDYVKCFSLEKIILRTQDEMEWKEKIIDKLNQLKYWKVIKGETIFLHRLS